MRPPSASAGSSQGFTLLLRVGAIAALVMCAWTSSAGADQNDPRLPALFEALKATGDPEEGDRIGRQISEIWNETDDEGVQQIMRQGQRFLAHGQPGLALGNFTTVTRMEPGFAEAWNKRASLLYSLGRLDDAARSIAETVAREPRHFLAIAGLGLIYLQMGYLEEALRVFEHALTINPHLAGTRTAADTIRQRLSE